MDPFGVYGGGSTTKAPTYKTSTASKNAGKQYDPFNIGSVQAVPKPAAVANTQPAQQPTQQPKQSKSFLNKLASGTKSLASAATTGEQQLAHGVARVLPGGSNDLKAEQQSAAVDTKNQQTYADLHKAGKISDAQYQKLTQNVAQQSGQNQQAVTQTTKSMPTKTQIALGGASTAADLLTAGSLPEIKALAGASKAAKAGRAATQLAANATAGGLNAAAGGGTKKDIIKNAAAGALLPEVLHQGANLTKAAGNKAIEKLSTKPAKELIQNTKTQNILEKLASKQDAQTAKTAVADLPTIDTSHLGPKTAAVAEAVPPVTRAPEAIKADIQTNADHIKTITGKNPASFVETKADGTTSISQAAPKDIKPYLEKHQELQKEYVQATSPSADVVTSPTEPSIVSGTPTKPTTPESATATPESKPASQPTETAKTSENVSSANSTPVRGTSKIAQDIQTQAVKRGLKNDFGDAGGYDKLTIADQAKKAVALTNDRPALEKVISGEAPLPEGLRATALIKAVENHPELGKNPEIIRKLSQAEHLTGESSRSAQELRLAAERNPTSPVEAARAVRKAREDAFQKKTGKSVTKAVSSEVRAIRAAKPKVTKQSWSEFIDSIKC